MSDDRAWRVGRVQRRQTEFEFARTVNRRPWIEVLVKQELTASPLLCPLSRSEILGHYEPHVFHSVPVRPQINANNEPHLEPGYGMTKPCIKARLPPSHHQ